MDIQERLAQELEQTTARLRHEASLALLDDGPTAVADTRGTVDEVDGAQRSVEREMTLANRSRLRQRAQRLAGALERLRDGLYGVCEECDGPIAPARLAALPEVTTCVVCQSRLEMAASRGEDLGALFDDSDVDDGLTSGGATLPPIPPSAEPTFDDQFSSHLARLSSPKIKNYRAVTSVGCGEAERRSQRVVSDGPVERTVSRAKSRKSAEGRGLRVRHPNCSPTLRDDDPALRQSYRPAHHRT